MNKQEKENLIIKLYNNISDNIPNISGSIGLYLHIDKAIKLINEMPETELTTEQAWEKIAEDYDQEPEELHDILENATFYGGKAQKVKVPKWFAEYLDKIYFHDGYLTLKILWTAYTQGNLSERTAEFVQNNVELVTKAVLYGCKPIEPRYLMPVPYANKDNGGNYYCRLNEKLEAGYKFDATRFTAAEIDKYFPKIKEFAEEVEG